jgi:hypothetical protein
MWFFKRKKGTEFKAVIHNDCYQKLPDTLKNRFYPAPSYSEPTHIAGTNNGEDWVLGALVSGGPDLLLGSSDTPTENYSIDESSAATPDTDFDFGGGSGGGAGATDGY